MFVLFGTHKRGWMSLSAVDRGMNHSRWATILTSEHQVSSRVLYFSFHLSIQNFGHILHLLVKKVSQSVITDLAEYI